MKSAKLALFICFPATTGRYNCDIDISGKLLYNLEKTFSKQEKNTLSRAIDYEGGNFARCSMDNKTDFIVVLPKTIITIPQDSNLAWLTLFYALPRELRSEEHTSELQSR